jgi:hypothetical protein
MLQEKKVYTLSEFCKVLKESQEFKARKGKNVESEDKKNNEKAVNDILKQGKKFDGGLSDKKKKENPRDITDYNKTTLDNDFAYEPSKEYKDRVKAQVHGFPSAENEKNSKIEEENDSLDFEGNKDFYKQNAEKRKKVANARQTDKHAGLKSHNLPKETFKDNTLYTNESRKMKRLNFSKTVFLNEAEMMKKIPDDMKIDGNKFYMKDAVGNEYLVECVKDKAINDIIHTKVVDYRNKEKIDETFKRMKELYGYKSSTGTQNSGKFENGMVGKMISESKEKLFIKNEDTKERFFKTLIESQE